MRVAIYVRVSTIEQYKEGYSIAEQIKRLTKYAEAKGWTVYKVYIDVSSGANMERDGLQEMLRDVKYNVFDGVLVYKLDRLSRSQRDTLEIIEKTLLPSKKEFISMTENLDTSTPFGLAMIGILSVFAQLEREQIKERMAIGIAGRAQEGKWHGAKCSPIGYEYKDDKLHLIPYEAMMVKEAFELFVKRVPIGRICSIFEKKGYKHRYGHFLASSLGKTLKKELYAGFIKKDGELYKAQHEPIISKELFDQAQKVFEERAEGSKASFKRNSALGGLVYCKRCGAKYCRVLGHTKQDGTKSAFYVCYSRNKKVKSKIIDPNCKNRIWRIEELDGKVFEEITKLSFDPEYIERIKAADPGDEKAEKIELLEEKIESLTAQISRYSDLYSLGSMEMDEIKEKIDPLTSERTALKAELGMLVKASEASTEETFKLARSFGEALESGDQDEVRFIIEELVEKIEVDGEKVRIFWTFS
jgi:site-specific DNA recombinase